MMEYDVTIRDFEYSDIEKKIEWINNPENNYYLHYDLPLEYEKTCNWFKNKDNSKRRDFVIEANGKPVGLIGLLAIDRLNRKAEFYISMGEIEYKRKGISTKAIGLVLEYAFKELGLNKVYLNVDADNVAACNLYEKAGFVCEGLFKHDLLRNDSFIDRKRYSVFSVNGMEEVLR